MNISLTFMYHEESREMSHMQVALMFLTRGDMPHEASWAAWLRSAEGMVPIDPAQDALCAHKPAPGKCPWANGVRQVRGVKPPDLTCSGICWQPSSQGALRQNA